jgi:hypothetical protein
MNRAVAGAFLTLLFAFAAIADAQEVQSIDLTTAPQRVALRYPPPAPLTSGNGIASGGGGGSVSDCAPDIRDPHAAAVYLDGVDGKEIDPEQPFQAAFRFVNTGRLPINVPVSPDLSDLQPADPSVPFSYLSLGLVVRVRNNIGSTGYVQLYGTVDHNGTTRVLKPGEWIRVKANLKLNPQPPSCTSLTLLPGFYMHSNRFSATSHGFWEDSHGICVNENPIAPPTSTALCEQPHDASSE